MGEGGAGLGEEKGKVELAVFLVLSNNRGKHYVFGIGLSLQRYWISLSLNFLLIHMQI